MNLERWATDGRSWEGGGVGCARRVFIECVYSDPVSVVNDMTLVFEIDMKIEEERKERERENRVQTKNDSKKVVDVVAARQYSQFQTYLYERTGE